MTWDLIIVGGGPVGLVTAIAARRAGLSALVVERSRDLPVKACGEGLMPGAVAVLRELGVSLDAAVEFCGVRFIADDVVAEGRFPEQGGRALGRSQLMLALSERAASLGVERLAGHTLRDFAYDGRVARAHVQAPGGGMSVLRGRLLVGADGLRSFVRRRLGYQLPPRRAGRFGLQRHYRCAPWSEWVEVYFSDRADAYVTPLGAHEVGLALLTHGRPQRFEALLSRFPALAARLPASSAGRVRGAGPFEQRARDVLAPGVALVGDAAGYLDAVSGEGLALGFRSASALVSRFASGELWRYRSDHARITASHHALTLAMLEISQRRWLRRAVLAHLRDRPALFRDLLGIAADSRAPAQSVLGAALGRALVPMLVGARALAVATADAGHAS